MAKRKGRGPKPPGGRHAKRPKGADPAKRDAPEPRAEGRSGVKAAPGASSRAAPKAASKGASRLLPSSLGRWSYVLVFAFAVLLYAASADYQYVLDDNAVVTSNRWVQQGFAGILPLLKTHYFAGYYHAFANYYRPLSLITFAIEFQFFGFDPGVSHKINILLYGLGALVLLRLFRALWQRPGTPEGDLVPLAAALLFVANPLHVEVAANIKSRDELMGLIFLGLCLLWLLRYAREGDWRLALAGGLSFFLAMITKESGITWLAAVPLTVWVFSSASPRRIGLSTLALVPGVVLAFALRYNATGRLFSVQDAADEGLVGNNLLWAAKDWKEETATIFLMFGKYLKLLFWPDPLIWDYSIGQVPIVGFDSAAAWAGILASLVLLGLIAWRLRRGDVVGWALAWGAITFSLYSNTVVKVVGATMAERYLFLLTVGFCVLLAHLAWRASRGRLPVFLALVGLLGVAWTARSAARIPAWADNRELVLSNVEDTHGNPRMVGAFASIATGNIAGSKDPEDVAMWDARAKEVLGEALELHAQDPERYALAYVPAHFGLGMNAWHQKRYEEALEHLRAVVREKPDYAQAWFYIGWIHYNAERWDDAVAAYELAVEHRPKNGVVPGDSILMQDYYLNLCLAYYQAGLPEAALKTCEEGLYWQEDYARLWNLISAVQRQLGHSAEADAAFQRAVELDPSLGQ